MARTKTRPSTRPPAAQTARASTPWTRRLRPLARPESLGGALVVIAAAILIYLLPLDAVPVADVLARARDGFVELFGVHVFTVVALLAALGALVATRRVHRLRHHERHLGGAALVLVFSSGLLGLWRPDVVIGGIGLDAASAGGEAGRWLSGSVLVGLGWILTGLAGFTLLWPRTSARIARATPGASIRASVWAWQHGPRQAIAALVASVRRFGESDVPNAAEINALRARRVGADTNGTAAVAAPAPDTGVDEAPAPADLDDLDAPEEAEEPADDGNERPAVQIPMDMEHGAAAWRHSSDGWQLPPMDLLQRAEPAAPAIQSNEHRAQLIVDTLASFGVDAAVTQINEGPAVTQFGVEPGWNVRTKTIEERTADGKPILDDEGQPRTKEIEVSRTRVRVSRITSLQHDLALSLAAPALRIEAPVPGKSIVGIEVPNGYTSIVSLRSVLESPGFEQALQKYHLPIALGSGVAGAEAVTDLAEMPHLLIAGATGSGKSVCLNAIIACLLMNYSPEQLRLVLVDPKRVELTAFADIPHLAFSNIVVDMDKVVGTLQAVIQEMETRYRAFAKVGVRNVETYNERNEDHPLPYWVVVIDELADLMLAAPYQVEHQLVRLAQLARATGIHLVVATQRPSVDVVTGLIKANFPTRIAFAVSSQVDSRTILDGGGAEKLLGKGDMLYQPKDQGKPTRLQGVYVSDEEIESVVAFWTAGRFESLRPPRFDDLLAEAEEVAADLMPNGSPPPNVDPMVTEALQLARDHTQLSTSMLQRRLRIGYPRAARVMDELEERGIVGAPEGGGGSRPVLLNDDEPSDGEVAPVAGIGREGEG